MFTGSEIAFLITAFAANIFSATFGTGAGLILIPISAMFMPIKTVIALTSILFLFSVTTKAVIFRRDVNWRVIFGLWLGTIPAVIIGAFLLPAIPDVLVSKLLGLGIMAYLISKHLGYEIKAKLTWPLLAIVGACIGFLSGLTGDSSAVRTAFFDHMKLDKKAFIGAMAVTVAPTNYIKAGIYAQSGLLTTEHIPVGIVLGVIAITSVYIGRYHLIKRVSPALFNQVIQFILLVVALKLLIF